MLPYNSLKNTRTDLAAGSEGNAALYDSGMENPANQELLHSGISSFVRQEPFYSRLKKTGKKNDHLGRVVGSKHLWL